MARGAVEHHDAPARQSTGVLTAVPGGGAQRPDEHGDLVRVRAGVERDAEHPGPGRTTYRRGQPGADGDRVDRVEDLAEFRGPERDADQGAACAAARAVGRLAPLRPPLRRGQRGQCAVPEYPVIRSARSLTPSAVPSSRMPTRTGAPGPGRSISAADACTGEAAAASTASAAAAVPS